MQVIDLIIKLQQLDQNMEVAIISAPKGSNVFKSESVVEVDEIELSTGLKLVGLFGPDVDYGYSEN